MILTQHGLRRNCVVTRRLVLGIALVVSPALSALCANWDREGARRAWEEANKLQQALHVSSPTRESYLKCIRTYQEVYTRDPHFAGSPEAIYEAAVLYQEMGERFGDLGYYRSAAKLFDFLTTDYGGSVRCPEALLNLGLIYEKNLMDQAAAEAAYAKLKARYGASQAARSLNSRSRSSKTLSAAPPAPAAVRNVGPTQVDESAKKPASPVLIREVRLSSDAEGTRVSVVSDGQLHYSKSHLANPERLYFDISGARMERSLLNRTFAGDGELLRQVRVAQNQHDVVRIVLDLGPPGKYSISDVGEAFGISVSIVRKGSNPVRPVGPKTQPAPTKAFADKSVPLPPEVLAAAKSPESNQANVKPEVQGRGQAAVAGGPAKGDAGIVWQAQLPPIDSSFNLNVETKGSAPAKPGPEKSTTPQVSKTSSSTKTGPGQAEQVLSVTSSAVTKAKPARVAPETKDVSAHQQQRSEPRTNPPGVAVTKPEAKTQVVSGSLAAKQDNATSTQVPAPPKATSPGIEKSKDAAKADIPRSPITPEPPSMPKTALPTSKGDRTLTRMLGLKIGRIVLDPGHGGHDMGTIGPSGLLEKNLVLQVAKELKKLLQDRLGAEVIMTRSDDTFVSLEERTAFANQQQADLFLSIHANSSTRRNISGVETYFLDFARSDAAREVAARENAISDRNVRDLQDLIQQIAQADKKVESREFAEIVQKNLFTGVHKMIPSSQDRGVRSAPFIVLIGAHMPSVLAEVAFISNPRDEKLLKKEVSCQSLAAALFRGVEGYMKALGSGVAQNHGHPN